MSSRTLSRPASGKSHNKPRLQRLEICVNGSAFIPSWVVDHESYRRWARSDEYPEKGHFAYLNGTIWIDLTMEQVFSHNSVKTAISSVLASFVRERDLGYFFSDGNLVSHPGASLSSEPDACFLSYETIQSLKARWIAGKTEGVVEIEGSPDMTLEVVSTSSVAKDTVDLRELYWKAGVSEYWLIDARAETLSFSVLKHAARGYVQTRRQSAGWLKSQVFGVSFRLTQHKDRLGNPQFTLELR
jgi:Uma2 family endonuclease